MIDAPRNTAGVENPLPVAEDPEGSILDIWGLVKRRKWLILLGLVTCLGLAGLYYFQATPIFESKIEVLVMPKNQTLPTAGTNASGHDQGSEVVDQGIMATHVQLLQSPRIILAALKAIDINQMATFQEAIAEAQLKGEDFDPLDLILHNLEVTAGGEGKAKEARVLQATFRGPYAKENAEILNALVESYQSFLGETFSDTSQEAVELITTAKEKLGKELVQLEDQYREFREETPIFWKGKESLNLHQERLGKIEEALSEVTQRFTETQARLKIVSSSIEKKGGIDKMSEVEQLALLPESDVSRLTLLLTASRPDPNAKMFQATDPIRREQAQAEYTRLLSLMLDEAKLMEDYGSDHPKVQSVREQIKLTQDFLRKNSPKAELLDPVGMKPEELLAAHLGLLEHDLAEFEERRTELQRLAKEEEKAAKELVGYELRGETMSGEIDRKKELYETIIDRLREISLIKDYGGYLTEVITPATVPKKRASPRLILVAGLGGLIGLFFGGGLAFLADLVDKTFRTPDEVCHTLDLPILAHVPRIRFGRERKQASTNGDGRKLPGRELVTFHTPNSAEAEAIRGLRTALYFGQHGASLRVLQVTSPNPLDGKTTVIGNLAITAANAGRRVLMIDADLRRPRLEKIFNATAEIGLAEVLKDEIAWYDAVQDTQVPNLSILPCGTIPDNPSELLTLDRLDEVLELMREQYDLVLIDSPPLLAVSDAATIASRVDGVLLTIRICKNGGPAAIHAKEMLAAVDANVVGVVVNEVEENKTYRQAYYGRKYGYGYGYKRKYGYTYGDDAKKNGSKKKEKVEV